MTVLKWIALAAMVGYLGGTAVLFFQQRSFIFPVPTTSRTAPAAAGLPGAEEQVLTTTDGEQVIVWHVPPRPGHAVVLFFHGNGDFLAGLVGRFREITRDGTGLVALSYRGYAGSTGRPSEQGLLLDADAAYGFALARYGAERIVAWGFSLGSGVAVALAANHPVSKLVLEAPFTSVTDVAAAKLPFIPVGWLLRDQFRSDRRSSHAQIQVKVELVTCERPAGFIWCKQGNNARVHHVQLHFWISRSIRRAFASARLPVVAHQSLRQVQPRLGQHLARFLRGASHQQLYLAFRPRRTANPIQSGFQLGHREKFRLAHIV